MLGHWVIAREIEQGATQGQVAKTYALAIMGGDRSTDWAAANKSITERWSRSGLERVKSMAWKHVNEEREG